MISMMMKINVVPAAARNNMIEQDASWNGLKKALSVLRRKGSLTLVQYRAADAETQTREQIGLGWIPCSLIDQSALRVQGNMKNVALIVLNSIDGLLLSEIELILKEFEFAAHTCYSHSAEMPKWRVIMPMQSAIVAGDLPIVFDHFNTLFGGRLDSVYGHDPAHLYNFPACPAGAETFFTFTEHNGAWVDAAAICNSGRSSIQLTVPLPMPVPVAVVSVAVPVPVVVPLLVAVAPVAAVASLTKGDPDEISFGVGVAEGHRHHELSRRAGRCLDEGDSIEAATKRCLDWNMLNDPPGCEKELRDTVTSIFKAHAQQAIEHDLEVVVDSMNRRYAWLDKYGRIYRFEYGDLVLTDVLRKAHANTSIECVLRDTTKFVTHTEAWLCSPARRSHRELVFVPGAGAIDDDCINLWRGWSVTAKAGDVSLWTALLDHLFSGNQEHRKWFEQWLAYPIQHPGTKLNTAAVLWSARQGVGKTMVGETVGKLYGAHFRTLSAVDLHGSFNSWAKACQFVLGEENASSNQRADSDKLKHLITGNTIVVNEKQKQSFELKNVMNFLFTSNHPDAFHLEDHDRRFFVWEIRADRLPDDFYSRFVVWRDNQGGLAALMAHFAGMDLTRFNPKANAPMTEAKIDMIAQGHTDIEIWLKENMEEASIMSKFGKEIVTLDDVVAAYQREGHGRTNSVLIGKAFRQVDRPVQRRISTKGGRRNLISLVNHDRWGAAENDEWAGEFAKPMPAAISL